MPVIRILLLHDASSDNSILRAATDRELKHQNRISHRRLQSGLADRSVATARSCIYLHTLDELLSESSGWNPSEVQQLLFEYSLTINAVEPYNQIRDGEEEEEKKGERPHDLSPSSKDLIHAVCQSRLHEFDLIWLCTLDVSRQREAWNIYCTLQHLCQQASMDLSRIPVVFVHFQLSELSNPTRCAHPSCEQFARSIGAVGCSCLHLSGYSHESNPSLSLLLERAQYISHIRRQFPKRLNRASKSSGVLASSELSSSSLPTAANSSSLSSSSSSSSPLLTREFRSLDDFHLQNVCIELEQTRDRIERLLIHSSFLSDRGLRTLIGTIQHFSTGARCSLHTINVSRAFDCTYSMYTQLIHSFVGLPLQSLTIVGNTLQSSAKPQEDSANLHQSYELLVSSTPTLTHLYLSELPSTFLSITDLEHLTHLDLSGIWNELPPPLSADQVIHPSFKTFLSHASPGKGLFSAKSRLQQLNLSNNNLADELVVECLVKYLSGRAGVPPGLTALNLSKNNLRGSDAFWNTMHQLLQYHPSHPSLTSLDLSSNQLQTVPASIYLLPHLPSQLKQLNLKANPINNLPSYIVQGATPQILTYFAHLRVTQMAPTAAGSNAIMPSSKPKRVRLMLIGHGAAGKSHLKNTLLLSKPTLSSNLIEWSTQECCDLLRAKSVDSIVIDELSARGFCGLNLSERDPVSLRYDLVAMLAADEDLYVHIDHILQVILDTQIQADSDIAAGRNLYSSTVGIQSDILTVQSWDHRLQRTVDVEVEVVDFAGQQEYFAAHSLFLRDIQAIYVVVNNLVRDSAQKPTTASSSPTSPSVPAKEFNSDYEAHIHFWLSFLQSMLPINATVDVAVVQTHLDVMRQVSPSDEIPDSAQLQQALQQQFRPTCPHLTVAQLDYSQKDVASPHAPSQVRSALIELIARKAASYDSPWLEIEHAVVALTSQKRQGGSHAIIMVPELIQLIYSTQPYLFPNLFPPSDPRFLQPFQPVLTHLTCLGLVLPVQALNLVILGPLEWFSHCIAAFVAANTDDPNHHSQSEGDGAPVSHAIRTKDGICEWSDIVKHQHQLLCKDEQQLRVLMQLLTQLGLCYPITAAHDSASSAVPSPPSKFLFPCLLPHRVNQFDHIQTFFSLDAIERDFNDNIKRSYFARLKEIEQQYLLKQAEVHFPIPRFVERGPNRFVASIVGRDWSIGTPVGLEAGSAVPMGDFPPTFFASLQMKLFMKFGFESCVSYGKGFICIEPGGSSRFAFEKACFHWIISKKTVRVLVNGYAPQFLFHELVEVFESLLVSHEQLEASVQRFSLCRFCLGMLCLPHARQVGSVLPELYSHLLPHLALNQENELSRGSYAILSEVMDRFRLQNQPEMWARWKAKMHAPAMSDPSAFDPAEPPLTANLCWLESGPMQCSVSNLVQHAAATLGDRTNVAEMERALDPYRRMFYHPKKKKLYLLSSAHYSSVQVAIEDSKSAVGRSQQLFDEFSESDSDENDGEQVQPCSEWACVRCTMLNPPLVPRCRMCDLDRNQIEIENERAQYDRYLTFQQNQQLKVEKSRLWEISHPVIAALSTSKNDSFEFEGSAVELFQQEQNFPAHFDTMFTLSDRDAKRDELVLVRGNHHWKQRLKASTSLHLMDAETEASIDFLQTKPWYPRSSLAFSDEWRQHVFPFLNHRDAIKERLKDHVDPGSGDTTSTSTSPPTIDLSALLASLNRMNTVTSSTLALPWIPYDDSNKIGEGHSSEVFAASLSMNDVSSAIRQSWIRHPSLQRFLHAATSSSNSSQLQFSVALKVLKKSSDMSWFHFAQRFLRELVVNLQLFSEPHPHILPLIGYSIRMLSANGVAASADEHKEKEGHSHLTNDCLSLDEFIRFLSQASSDLNHQPNTFEFMLIFPRVQSSLETLIVQDRTLSISNERDLLRFTSLLQQASGALGHCHQLGLIHGDIRLSSFLCESNRDHLYLMDFGLSQFLPSWNELEKSIAVSPHARVLPQRNSSAHSPEGIDHPLPPFASLPSSILDRIVSFSSLSNRVIQLQRVSQDWKDACKRSQAPFGFVSPSEFIPYKHVAPEMVQQAVYSRSTDVYQFGRLMMELLGIWPTTIPSARSSFTQWMLDASLREEYELIHQGIHATIQIESHRWPRAFVELISGCCSIHPDQRPSIRIIQEKFELIQNALVKSSMNAAGRASLLSTSARYYLPFTDGYSPSTAQYIELQQLCSPTTGRLPAFLPSLFQLGRMPSVLDSIFQHPVSNKIYAIAGNLYWRLEKQVNTQQYVVASEFYPKLIGAKWNWPFPKADQLSYTFCPWKYAPFNVVPIDNALYLFQGDMYWKLIGVRRPVMTASSIPVQVREAAPNENEDDDLAIDPDPSYPRRITQWNNYADWKQEHLTVTSLNRIQKIIGEENIPFDGHQSYAASSAEPVAASLAAPKSIELVYPIEQCLVLAECLLWGWSPCPRHVDHARDIFRILAWTHQIPHAWYRLGILNEAPYTSPAIVSTTSPGPPASASYFIRAAENGCVAALARVHRHGFGSFRKDVQLAVRFAQLAVLATPLDPAAYVFLASFNSGDETDELVALELYNRAVLLGDDSCIEALALLLVNVKPPEKRDVSRAMFLLNSIRDASRYERAQSALMQRLDEVRKADFEIQQQPWTCAACTYINTTSNNACVMCQTRRTEDDNSAQRRKSHKQSSLDEEKALSLKSVESILATFNCQSGIVSKADAILVASTPFSFELPESLPSYSTEFAKLTEDPSLLRSPQDFENLFQRYCGRKNVNFYRWNRGNTDQNDSSESASPSIPVYSWLRPHDMRTFAELMAEEQQQIEAETIAKLWTQMQSLVPSHYRLQSHHYSHHSLLGSGLSSKVWKGQSVAGEFKGSIFAIKEFSADGMDKRIQLPTLQLLSHFKHELQIYLALPKHPSILDFFGAILEERPIVGAAVSSSSSWPTSNLEMKLVLQYMSQRSLEQVLSDPAGLLTSSFPNPNRAALLRIIRILRECASALCLLHSRGIIHCDVAARNFLLDADFKVRICDFGLARFLPKAPVVGSSSSAKVDEFARTGLRDGGSQEILPRIHMSPESLLGPSTSYSRGLDIWSFSILMWECFASGRKIWNTIDWPELQFPAMNPIQREASLIGLISRGHVKVAPSPLWPPEIQQLIKRCSDPNPKMREVNASMSIIVDELTNLETKLESGL